MSTLVAMTWISLMSSKALACPTLCTPSVAETSGLTFPKVDADELKAFDEPLYLAFHRIDGELKPFPEELEGE